MVEALAVPAAIRATREALLDVSDLRTHFAAPRGTVRAVDGVTLRLYRGETLAVVGESGSGKSVTGYSIMRLLRRSPGRIVSGRVLLTLRSGERVDLTQLPERRMRQIRGREIAMIFQDPMSSLNPVFTVGDQISEAIITHQGRGHSEARAEATRLLRLVGIPAAEQRVSEYPHRLSGGMRQRVMIAMALACDPQVLIADEPTTALDVTIQQQIVSLLDKLRHERQLGIIFITHDLRLVAEIAQRVAVMYCGQIVEEGPAQKVLSAPRHPYTVALLRCLPTARASGPLEAISGAPADPVHPPQGCRFHPRCPIATDACRRDAVPLFDLGGDQQTRCLRTSEVQALQ